ncbi:MAG: T9SS type A sorting domain-containing protein [Flavobacterium sp.]|nr:T9SS type A sorting domain-containing protein [Flavobacterium sp.]
MKKTVLISTILFCTNAIFGQDGSLDNTFGTNGKVSISHGTVNQKGNAVAMQSDEKIVVVGSTGNGTNSDFAVMRLNPNGSLDNSFDSDGKVMTNFEGWDLSNANDYATSVAIQTDGKIVVAGYGMFLGADGFSTVEEFALARYNIDGSLDTTFDADGKVHTRFGNTISGNAYAVKIQSDGKIVVAGFSQQANTKNFAVIRYNADGSLDTTFDGDGMVLTQVGTPSVNLSAVDEAHSLAIQVDGKIVVAGFATNGTKADFAIARYNTDGSIDTTLDGDGIQTTSIGTAGDVINDVKVQTDGKIVVVGYTEIDTWKNFAIARYNSDGSFDTSFDGDGKQTLYFNFSPENTCYANAAYIQNDGKILIAGSDFYFGGYDFALARLNADGSKDNSFNFSGLTTTSLGTFDYSRAMTIQTDGKIVLAGSKSFDSEFAVVRYNNTNPLATNSYVLPSPEIVIYPNPSSEFFSIKSNQNLEAILLTIDGKQVQKFAIKSMETETISGLSAGVYILKTIDENQKINCNKIVIQ